MSGKQLLSLNLAWALVAVGAYLAGSARESEPVNAAGGGGAGGRPKEVGDQRPPSSLVRASSSQNSISGRTILPNQAAAEREYSEELKLLLVEDVDAAKARVASIESDEIRKKMHGLIVKHYAATDLDAGLAYLEDVSEAGYGYRIGIYEVIDEMVARRGVDALKDWVEQIDTTERTDLDEKIKNGGNEKFQKVAAQRAVRLLAKEDPELARDWIIENADRDWFGAYDLECVAKNIDFDPRNQLDWVAGLPGMPMNRRDAIGKMFTQYASVNLAGAGEWLAGQELSQIHDEAIRVYAFEAARWDPEAARDWAAQISDGETRTEALDRLVQE